MRLVLSLLLYLPFLSYSQDINDKLRASLSAQEELDSSYASPIMSPLTPEDLASFTGLPFFPVDTNWIVLCELTLTPEEEPFEMATSTDRKPLYRKYGILTFTIGDSICKLSVYQNIAFMNRPGFEDYLFLPFGDLTNGISTYGGGRYIELYASNQSTIEVDFNTSFNPYCAYNNKYSCPRIPAENMLNIEVKAGVQYSPKLLDH